MDWISTIHFPNEWLLIKNLLIKGTIRHLIILNISIIVTGFFHYCRSEINWTLYSTKYFHFCPLPLL